MEQSSTEKAPSSWSSPEYMKVLAALAKAQGEFPDIPKGKTARVPTKAGGEYTYQYADIADVLKGTRPALSKHGLAVVQRIEQRAQNEILITIIGHESGEWISSSVIIPRWDNAQALGSLLTYLRRYALCGLIGVAAEEDQDGRADGGERAQGRQNAQQQSQGAGGGGKAFSGPKPNAPKPGGNPPAGVVVPPPDKPGDAVVGFGQNAAKMLRQLSEDELTSLGNFFASVPEPKGKAKTLKPFYDAFMKQRGTPAPAPAKKATFAELMEMNGWSEANVKEWVTLKFKIQPGTQLTDPQRTELEKIVRTTRPEEAIYLVRDPQ